MRVNVVANTYQHSKAHLSPYKQSEEIKHLKNSTEFKKQAETSLLKMFTENLWHSVFLNAI